MQQCFITISNGARKIELRNSQNLLIGCAWLTSEKRCLFKVFRQGSSKCYESWWYLSDQQQKADVYHMHTNRKISLVVSWSLGPEILNWVNFIMTNWDIQEMNELEIAVDKFMPRRTQILWLTCYQKGWKCYCLWEWICSHKAQAEFKTVVCVIKTWFLKGTVASICPSLMYFELLRTIMTRSSGLKISCWITFWTGAKHF